VVRGNQPKSVSWSRRKRVGGMLVKTCSFSQNEFTDKERAQRR
jgi:hypothetical protein